jgi:hypothetical protein
MTDDELPLPRPELRRALRELASAGDRQPTLFPDQQRTPDEIAFAFEQWSAAVRDEVDDPLTDAQRAALDALATKLSTMSRDGAEFDAELWTDAAAATSEQWADVRQLASAALDAFEWMDGETDDRTPVV